MNNDGKKRVFQMSKIGRKTVISPFYSPASMEHGKSFELDRGTCLLQMSLNTGTIKRWKFCTLLRLAFPEPPPLFDLVWMCRPGIVSGQLIPWSLRNWVMLVKQSSTIQKNSPSLVPKKIYKPSL